MIDSRFQFSFSTGRQSNSTLIVESFFI